MRNRQMIVHWLIANTNAVEVRKREGRTFYVMTDRAAFRDPYPIAKDYLKISSLFINSTKKD
jgi:hypothetical protein